MKQFIRHLPRSILITTMLYLTLAIALAFDLVPFLRGGFGWQWPYQPAQFPRVVLVILAAVIYVVGSWLLVKRAKSSIPVLLWAALGAVIIPLTVVALRSDDVIFELFARTVSGVTTGPHMVAAEMDWSSDLWRDWPTVMNSYEGRSVHARLSPPGLPIWYGLLNAFMETTPGTATILHRALLPFQCQNWNLLAYTPAEWATASFGMLMPVWAAISVLPLYAVARKLNGGGTRMAVLWWPLVPALVMFAPTWNTLYPLFSLCAFWMLLAGLERKYGTIWFLASGLLTGLLTFANFSLIPLIAFLGIYTILSQRQSEHSVRGRTITIGGWFGVGLALPWLVYTIVTGLTPLVLLQVAMNSHLALDRPYLPWLWLHFWEWALFTGVPLIALWLLGARHGSRYVLTMALLLTMILLLLTGTARGETGRVWLFFSPFVLIASGQMLTTNQPPDTANETPSTGWLLIAASQTAIMVALAVTWPVINAPDIHPRPAPPGGVGTTQPMNVNFADSFRLGGWDAAVGNDSVTLRLDWQGAEPMTTPYWFSALLVAPEGTPVLESIVWQPLETHYPTTCWAVNEWVGDTINIPLPENARAGEWWISLAAFADTTRPEERLLVTLADGTQDTQVGLGPVTVP